MRKSLLKILSLLFIIGLNWFGLSAIVSTVAYYNDMEASRGNSHSAGSFDFSLAASDWTLEENVLDLDPGESISREITVVNEGSLDFQYAVSSANLSGDSGFCDVLELNVSLDGAEKYSGSLTSFASSATTTTVFGDWNFEIIFPLEGGFSNKSCEFDFVFFGWQAELSSASFGFNDDEVIGNTIRSGEEAPEPEICVNTEIVSMELIGTDFNFGNSNVIIARGGALVASGDTINVSTFCDFSINNGGEVRANGENGGVINLTVGGDLSVAGNSIEAQGGSGIGIQNGGVINIDVEGDFNLTGDVNSSAQESGGSITINIGGDFSMSSAGKILARSNASRDTNRGGIVKIASDGNANISGIVNARGQEAGGVIEIVVQESFTLASSGILRAVAGSSRSFNTGGNISVIARGGDTVIDGRILANAQDLGGKISIIANGDLEITKKVKANSGISSEANTGGEIIFITPKRLTISADVRAKGADIPGTIQTNYCAKDFSEASFNPDPLEITNCASVVLNEFLPNPNGDDDALKPNGEWIELYNYGSADINVGGWFLYDNYDAHDLEIISSDTDTGNTIVPAGGFLIVYRNGDGNFSLNNSGGDSVRLFDGAIASAGTLRDVVLYLIDASSGKSFARVPDGGVWYDPDPTPGLSNNFNFDYLENFFDLLFKNDKEDFVIDVLSNNDSGDEFFDNDNLAEYDENSGGNANDNINNSNEEVIAGAASTVIDTNNVNGNLDFSNLNNNEAADNTEILIKDGENSEDEFMASPEEDDKLLVVEEATEAEKESVPADNNGGIVIVGEQAPEQETILELEEEMVIENVLVDDNALIGNTENNNN